MKHKYKCLKCKFTLEELGPPPPNHPSVQMVKAPPVCPRCTVVVVMEEYDD